MTFKPLQDRLKEAGLRVTPQRIAVLSALMDSNHPTAEQISVKVRTSHEHIATGTVYKILEVLVEKGIIHRVDNRGEAMRYDAILEEHHHLQSYNGEQIEDYFDEELNQIVKDYLSSKEISGFEISDIKIQIIGKFNKTKTKE